MAEIIQVTSPEQPEIVNLEWLKAAEAVHRQLRPNLPADYVGKMQSVFAMGGRMSVAVHEKKVVGVAVYRIHENTSSGLLMYVDDLVTDEAVRSTGVGKLMLDHLQHVSRDAGCTTFSLDSGVQRTEAHNFYFREGMRVFAFHFLKRLR
jgi:GNAT superfamily N-acetyltransferase